MISWNEGLSVGIDVIDNDHKKLLEIINRLSPLTHTEASDATIHDIFDSLEDYTLKHFSREESFMKKYGVDGLDAHMMQHRFFEEKIPELKENLLQNNDNTTIKKTCDFLTEWLINHIVHEDMVLVNKAKENNPQDLKKKESFLTKAINYITNKINFTNRIFLSTLIPLITMFIFGFMIIINEYNQYSAMKKTTALTQTIQNVNELIHALQTQRGISSGYISSNSNEYKTLLLKQHQDVSDKIDIFLKKLDTIDPQKLTSISANIKTFKKDILSLQELQENVLETKISHTKAINGYTAIIQNILDITLPIIFINGNDTLSKEISALSAISNYKETLGKEKAYGTIIFHNNKASIYDYNTFTTQLGLQKTYLHLFQQFATLENKKKLTSILNSDLSQEVQLYEHLIITQQYKEVDPLHWFNISSKYIDELKKFEDLLLNNTISLTENNINTSLQNLSILLIAIVILLVGTLVIAYILEQSSEKELIKFVQAMQHLSSGKRDMTLAQSSLKGAMSQMYTSYEQMRQKLLEGDLYTELFKNEKTMELQKQKQHNDELEILATIDPLTSCINRRKFDDLSNLELQKSVRYNTPLTLMMLDIDRFKSINDNYGHMVGDEVLKHFASLCMGMARDIDIVARTGGEEFAVVLPHTNTDGAYRFAERFREAIANSSLEIEGHKLSYTVSIGIASHENISDRDVADILAKADIALYKAKAGGRNRSIIYNEKTA